MRTLRAILAKVRPEPIGWISGRPVGRALEEQTKNTYHVRTFSKLPVTGTSFMPEIADPLLSSRYLLLSKPETEESQLLGPDPFLPRARDARGRFAKGRSGNPRGRPRGIPNPKRRVPDLIARPIGAEALSALLDRKPHLLRPLAAQLWPPPLAPIDAAKRLGIDLWSLRTVEDFRQVLPAVLAAVARGEIAPTEGARIARRVRARLRALRRLARLERRQARKTVPTRPALGQDALLSFAITKEGSGDRPSAGQR